MADQRLKISLCEFQNGTFELYIIDPDTGEEVQIDGKSTFTDKQREVLERLMPPCVFTTYVVAPPRNRITGEARS